MYKLHTIKYFRANGIQRTVYSGVPLKFYTGTDIRLIFNTFKIVTQKVFKRLKIQNVTNFHFLILHDFVTSC